MDKKIIEDVRQWKPPFKLGDIVTLYTGIKANSWTGKISDMWDGIYVVHQTLGKGTYFIKPYQSTDPKLKRVHETLTLSTVVDNKTVEKQPLFEDEGEETIKDTETEEWVIKQDSRTDPFLSPDLPFNPIPEDAKLLLQMSIPGYLYNLQDIRERQADLHKKEASFFIPLAIQVLHATFTEPTDNATYSVIMHGLMNEYITAELIQTYEYALNNMNQGPDERPRTFYARLFEAAELAEIDSESMIQSRFRAGLHPRIQQHCIAIGCTNIKEWLRAAEGWWIAHHPQKVELVNNPFSPQHASMGYHEDMPHHDSVLNRITATQGTSTMNDVSQRVDKIEQLIIDMKSSLDGIINNNQRNRNNNNQYHNNGYQQMNPRNYRRQNQNLYYNNNNNNRSNGYQQQYYPNNQNQYQQ
ncbi:uncharacterized protein BX664DRAFT_352134 [Halteromyces radiatus]|uniref:uncharacterized protein n=1 Tax=Halteromyces radiatus TaxID=101107 RepID=UPI00221F0C3D|nr:uncharacterized protein BX664DRAFT_352134 [Halteromyces radiatus]KAI8082866.1 hypothetical protein BX664DRAFT_352134 [Halteromyces radiatus]